MCVANDQERGEEGKACTYHKGVLLEHEREHDLDLHKGQGGANAHPVGEAKGEVAWTLGGGGKRLAGG